MASSIITRKQEKNRIEWIRSIVNNTESFTARSADTLARLQAESQESNSPENILGHLRLCGTIPEEIKVDSSAEKAYSKYTDSVVAEALIACGLTALVLDTRGNSADVEGVSQNLIENYDFVADAKAFRLTRTAKNQKDFKLSSLSAWKNAKKYGFVVAPSYHLPVRKSQIYNQITSSNVSILTFTHLATLVSYENHSPNQSAALLKELLDVPAYLNPSDSALPYWQTVNNIMVSDSTLKDIWLEEKEATIESLNILKQEGLDYLSRERSRIMKMTRQDAIQALISSNKIGEKEELIRKFNLSKMMKIIN